MTNFLMDEERRLRASLQAEFTSRLRATFTEAQEIYIERGAVYDGVAPVWHRVPFPGGFIHEIKKKTGRAEGAIVLQSGDDEAMLKALQAEMIDICNYSAFAYVVAEMLLARLTLDVPTPAMQDYDSGPKQDAEMKPVAERLSAIAAKSAPETTIPPEDVAAIKALAHKLEGSTDLVYRRAAGILLQALDR